jgi:3-oxoacyl-[acyl-carrier protein] reductase
MMKSEIIQKQGVLMFHRVALVTGASRGIGREIALTLCRSNFDIIVASPEIENNEAVADTVRQCGGNAMTLNLDVSSEESVKEGVSAALKKMGRIDVLVNNAGITRDGLAMRMKQADWNLVLQINLTGAFLTTQAVIPAMMKERWGRIINIASVVGEMGNAGQANYVASKSGLIGLTKCLAKELASRNITVNAIAPGFIARSSSAARRGLYHNTAAVIDADGEMRASTARCTSRTTRSTTRSSTSRPATSASRLRHEVRAHRRAGLLGPVVSGGRAPDGAAGREHPLLPDGHRLAPAEKAEYGAAQHDAWETIQRAHAIANGIYVAAVNRVGTRARRRRARVLGRGPSSPTRSAACSPRPPTRRRSWSSSATSPAWRRSAATGPSCATAASTPTGHQSKLGLPRVTPTARSAGWCSKAAPSTSTAPERC